MSVYFSIIYVSSVLQERIPVGLILADGTTVLSEFSDYKIDIIADFFDMRSQKLFKGEMEALKRCLSIKNQKSEQQQAFAAKAHLQKLSIYNNNLWTVSAPSDILIELNEGSLQRLFSTYISKIETAEKALPEVQTNSINA